MVELKHDGKVVNGSLPLFCIHTSNAIAFLIDEGLIVILATPNTDKKVVPKNI